MKPTQLKPDDSDRICRHMNNDHKEALVAFARHYGGCSNANQAKMLSLTPQAMELEVEGEDEHVKISFNHSIVDNADAHKTLVAMLQEIPRS